MNGLLISFEGMDGSGKSTQAMMTVEELNARGFDAIYIREPGGCEVGEEIREILLKKRDSSDRLCAKTELLLFMASRMQVVEEKIKPALEAGKIVIMDRFIDSTIAMQGYARGQFDYAIKLVNMFLRDMMPLRTYYLKINTEFQKYSLANKDLDRLESEGSEFHEKVHQGFNKCVDIFNRKYYSTIIPDAPDLYIWTGTAYTRTANIHLTTNLPVKFKGVLNEPGELPFSALEVGDYYLVGKPKRFKIIDVIKNNKFKSKQDINNEIITDIIDLYTKYVVAA